MIEFRDVKDLRKILHVYSVAPNEHITLCSVPPSSLLYAARCQKSGLIEVRRLDLGESRPDAAPERVIHKQRAEIHDMCFVQYGEKHLLVVVSDPEHEEDYIGGDNQGIFAYNTETDKLEWKLCGKPPGMKKALYPDTVTTDGRGHLFATDFEHGSIEMFSVSDGHYLGHFWALRRPNGISWCEKTTSILYVNSTRPSKKHIKVIKVKY